jgi:hypothetical protein
MICLQGGEPELSQLLVLLAPAPLPDTPVCTRNRHWCSWRLEHKESQTFRSGNQPLISEDSIDFGIRVEAMRLHGFDYRPEVGLAAIGKDFGVYGTGINPRLQVEARDNKGHGCVRFSTKLFEQLKGGRAG